MKTIIAGRLPIFRGVCSFCNGTYVVGPDDREYNNQFNAETDHPFVEIKCPTSGCKKKVTLNKCIDTEYLYPQQRPRAICMACLEGEHEGPHTCGRNGGKDRQYQHR